MEPPRHQARLRVYYDFEKPRSGRQVLVPTVNPSIPDEPPRVSVSAVQTALSEQLNVAHLMPHVFDGEAECFVPLSEVSSPTLPATPSVISPSHLACIDVKLVPARSHLPADPACRADSLVCDSSDTELTGSWFAIGILRGKVLANHGTLWRSALQLGASLTFTVGQRYDKKKEGCADVYKTSRQIPTIAYPDVTAFMGSSPTNAHLVAVEYGGVDLREFRHPRRAVYLLGSEDCGIPPALVARAQSHVSVPTAHGRPSSLNVATTGAIIMYDRLMKLERLESTTEQPNAPKGTTSEIYSEL